jgi:hypothetical protein
VLRITRSSIEATPAILSARGENDYMDGVCKFGDGKRMIMIINIQRMLSQKELSALGGIEDAHGNGSARPSEAPVESKPKALKKKSAPLETAPTGDGRTAESKADRLIQIEE